MPKYNNPRKTWRYADEFKIRAVEMSYQEGIQVQQVAEGLGIHPFMLSRWRKEYREGKIMSDGRKRVKKWQRYLAEQHQSDLDSSKSTDKN